ncbi:MAG TPA: ABC transporter ATP-binding protein [Vicinamibacterales bacterium]|nr:ABC transporter ATP-binding protein [Vicinamibacterales bacterium]
MNRRAFSYIRPYRRRLAVVLLVSLVSTALSLWLPYLTKSLVDDALIGRNLGALQRVVLLFAAAGAAGFALTLVSGLQYTRVSAEILFDMRRELYEHLQRLSPRFYASTRLGDIVSRINNDIAEIQRIAAEAALAWVGNVLFLAGAVAILIWMDWRLFLAGLATLPAAAWALVRYRRRVESRVQDVRERSADIGSFLIETLQAQRTIATSNAQAREVSRFTRLNDAFIASLMRLQRVHYIAGGLPALLLGAGTAAVFVYGGWRVVQGTMTLGTLAAFMAYQARVIAPVQALMGLYGALATARVSWTRVAALLDTRPEVVERPGAPELAAVRGLVEFQEVTLTHGRGGAVLEGVSFRAEPGQIVAIVGASGSGKSTIADLLVRLLDPDSGSVRLDGRDLRELRLADVRRHIQAVDQDPVLFHASVEENVRYGHPSASDAELARALEAAGIARFVSALPEGVRTIVGDRGLALSAGERQRLVLARAFLTAPSILVLDEPSAALDPAAEREVIAGYRHVMHARTVILISHRLDVIRTADWVVVLDGARVVEAGPPDVLLNSRGVFATLFQRDQPSVVSS